MSRPFLGYIHLNPNRVLTLTQNAIFAPNCTGRPTQLAHVSSILDTHDPFYSSIAPQLYVIGCATVVSYLLVIILFITPRTFYIGGPGGGANFLSRHGMISGSYSGNSSVVGVGGRPWLQKVAATLVAISLTIASVDSFKVARKQYSYGFSDSEKLSEQVLNGREVRVVQFISSTFLWLAQVQTLIRLFPRHKEKVILKWAGFGLVLLDTIFAILDNFLVVGIGTQPRLYQDAIPALLYLFELSLNLLYAACVVFYSLSKHRFAFFHPKMRNICLVALLSLGAVLIPVVFFVLDISKPKIAGWGMYIRWVGSAAASVVVWEWVERIEALEREESKDGILGREIFDGDEMLEVTPSKEVDWPRRASSHDRGGGMGTSSGWGGVMGLGNRPLRTRVGLPRGRRNRRAGGQDRSDTVPNGTNHDPAARPSQPLTVVTPISRGDTASAGSTVYNVRYLPVSSPTPPVAMPHMEEEGEEAMKKLSVISETAGNWDIHRLPVQQTDQLPRAIHTDSGWRSLLRPFRRGRPSLPREVAFAQAEEGEHPSVEGTDSPDEDDGSQGSRSGVDYFYPHNRRVRPSHGQQDDMSLPVTVIPAGRRGQEVWSPQWLDESSLRDSSRRQHRRPSHSDLPVRVIPSQPRRAAPWAGPNGEAEFGDNNYEMRYDPDAAALVGPDDGRSVDATRNVSVDQSSSAGLRDEFEEQSAPADHQHEESARPPTGQHHSSPGYMTGDSPGPQDSPR